MKIDFRCEGSLENPFIDSPPKGLPVPVVGDIISGKKRSQGGCYVYTVTARRFHYDWKEVWIFVKEVETKNDPNDK